MDVWLNGVNGGFVRARFLATVLFLSSFSALGAITGTVVSGDGRAVAGATVSAFALETTDDTRARWLSGDVARKPLATATTDGKGNFAIDAKAPVVDLRVDVAGQAPVIERAAANEDAGVLQAGGVAMTRGIISANGKPLAEAVVIVVSGGAESVTTTDATGRYPLPDPKRQASHVVVRHPDYATVEQDVGPILPAKSDVAMTSGISLTGRVVSADGQTAVANAIVQLDDVPVATTGPAGVFSIAHAPRGARRIVARAGNQIATRQLGHDRQFVLRLATSATISGSVHDVKGGVPVAGVQVTATAPRFGGSDPGASTVTDAKGSYTITGLTGGEYEVTAAHPSFTIPRLTINLPAGRSARKALHAVALGRISGSVFDEERHGITGVRVDIRPVGARDRTTLPGLLRDPRPTITAPDGRFVLRTADDGNLQLDATKKGLPAAHSGTLRVASGERKAGVEITIARGVALTGRVADRNAKPVAGAGISVSEPGEGVSARRQLVNSLLRGTEDLVRTETDGRFAMRVREGTYDVLVTALGFAPKSVRAREVSTSSPPLEVTLEPGVEVSGRVTCGGVPVEGVNVFTIGGDVGSPAQTGPDGTFRITDLSPGEMLLAFKKIGDFIQTTRAVTAPAAGVNVDLPAGGRVTGRVVDKATQQPVKAFDAGISVSRGGGGSVMMVPPVMHGFTTDDGTFAIDAVPVGSQTLAVNAPGYVMARVPNVNVEDGKTVENLEVALESGVRVSGHVTGPDGGPVGGALVRIDPMAGGRKARGAAMNDPYTLTDPAGEYVLENVEPGETTLAFSRSGLLAVQKSVTLTGPSAEVDAQLASGASIAGVVVLEGGTPVADALVRASSAADPAFGKSTQTEASGSFAIAGVAPGHYEITAGKAGYADAILRDVDITTAGSLRLIMKGGGAIAGRVTGLTPAELRSASIQASSADGSASASPDDAGSYRIEGVPAGTVRVSATAGQVATSARNAPMKSVHVEPGGTVNVDFDFRSDVTVSGRVTREGVPLPGAMVSFAPKAAAQRSARTSSDGNGRYEITGVDNGGYTVTVYDVARGPYSTSYEVSGSATFDIDMRGAALAGRVSDASTGGAIANASVELRRKDADAAYSRSAASGPNGEFSFDAIPAGSYEASAQKPSYGSATVPVTVGENGAPPVEVKLTPSPGLTLRVVDGRDNRPLNGWVHAESAGGDTFDGALSGGTEPARIPLSAGSYRVTIGAPGYAARTLTMSAPGEQTIALTPGGTIVVSSSSDTFAVMRMLDAAGQPYRYGPGPAAGMFRIDPAPGQTRVANIAAGTYTLQLVDNRNNVLRATQVTVGEGQIVPAKL